MRLLIAQVMLIGDVRGLIDEKISELEKRPRDLLSDVSDIQKLKLVISGIHHDMKLLAEKIARQGGANDSTVQKAIAQNLLQAPPSQSFHAGE